MSCDWNEQNLNPFVSINWRASLVPAAAVIPAPIAYIKVVAVKKARNNWISVEDDRSALWVCIWLSLDIFPKNVFALDSVVWNLDIYLEEIRVFQASARLEYIMHGITR